MEDPDELMGDHGEDEGRHNLIPPFLPNQTVFTSHLNHPRSPKNWDAFQSLLQSDSPPQCFLEGVIRQARHHPKDSSWEFKIHFKGWNARYDNWLPASQLLPDTKENRQNYNQQRTQRQAEAEALKREQQRKKQLKKELQLKQTKANAEFTAALLPFTLKTVLVDEREKITRCEMAQGPARSVHALPASVTIRQLLKHFEKKVQKDWLSKRGPDAPREALNHPYQQEVRQFCKGLVRLFETALPVCLLYPQERPQYQYYSTEKHRSVLDVYGCEFLLRLLLRLPQLMGKDTPALVADLTVLWQQNRPACFKGKFRSPTYPHEWLDWEKRHFGDPENKKETQAAKSRSDGEH